MPLQESSVANDVNEWGDRRATVEAQEQPQKKQPKGFWDTLLAPDIDKETLPVVIGERYHDAKSATAQFNRDNEWTNERKRRLAAGESTSGMENWKLQRINEIIKEGKPQQGPKPDSVKS